MPGRPKHKRKRDAFEGDGNRQRVSRVGRVMHCIICGGEGHNRLTCSVETGILLNNLKLVFHLKIVIHLL